MWEILLVSNFWQLHMWHSRVEIEHCSVAYFYRIDAFEAL